MQLVDFIPLIASIIGLLGGPIGYIFGRKRERAAIAKTTAETRKTDAETRKTDAEASDILIGNYQEMLAEIRLDLVALRAELDTERTRHQEREAELQADLTALREELDVERSRHFEREAELQALIEGLQAEQERRETEWSAELATMRNQIIDLKRQLTRERNLRKELEEERKTHNATAK